MERRILLVDADAFFVAVARRVDPEGAGSAALLIVGGSPDSRGVVCSASYEARQFGVRSAMPLAHARRLCPEATFVPVPRGECSRMSRQIRRTLERHAPVVEGASIDEWYLDLSGTERMHHDEPLATTAHRIRDAVRVDTGMTVSIGGGTSRFVAKLAVERAKPVPGSGADGVCIVAAGSEREFLRGFALGELPQVGPAFRERLERFGLRTVPDLLSQPAEVIERWLGVRAARWLLSRANGIDDTPVVPRDLPRQVSREETFAEDIDGDDALEHELLALVTRAAADLRGQSLAARTITVKLRDADFRTRSARQSLPAPIVADRPAFQVARTLLHRLRRQRRVPARLLGVALSSLSAPDDAAQLGLFDVDGLQGGGSIEETARDRALAAAVDRLRGKFGTDAIGPALLADRRRTR